MAEGSLGTTVVDWDPKEKWGFNLRCVVVHCLESVLKIGQGVVSLVFFCMDTSTVLLIKVSSLFVGDAKAALLSSLVGSCLGRYKTKLPSSSEIAQYSHLARHHRVGFLACTAQFI